jgi:hypothetical protein
MPIIDLGTDAHYWVESFLTTWLEVGVQSDGTQLTFIETWTQMVEYVFTSGTWERETPHAWKSREELYHHLLGLSWSEEGITGVEFRPIISSLLPYYRQWSQRWLSHVDSAIAFATFLRKPAASDLIELGLPELNTAVQAFTDYEWNRDRLAPALFELAAFLADGARLVELRTKSMPCYEAFLSLLAVLAHRQYTPAMALQDRLSSGV